MNECVICLDPCAETMPCCNVYMHVSCMCNILENGFNKCPHCQKELYTSKQLITPQYVPIPISFQQPVEVDECTLNCKTVTQAIGGFVLVLIVLNALFQVG